MLKLRLNLLLASALLLCSCLSEAKTVRKARVRIWNRTGQRLASVSVNHKYSDNYNEQHTWKGWIGNNERTGADLEVTYHTGFFTTGRDWWSVNYVLSDGRTMKVTDPKNFRDFIDSLEQVASVAVVVATAAAAGVASGGNAAAVIGAAAGSAAVADQIFNSGGTGGLKQHILRSEDEHQITEIQLTSNHEVRFVSRSGTSTTGTRTIRLPKPRKPAPKPVPVNPSSLRPGSGFNANPQAYPCSKWGWRFYDGADIKGHDIRYERRGHRNECQRLCGQTPGCRAYSWTAHRGTSLGPRCYLKRGAAQLVKNSKVYSALMCGSRGSSGGGRGGFNSNPHAYPCSQWGWRFYDGADIVGHDIRFERRSHRNECQQLCRKQPGCRAYSWTAHAGTSLGPRCYLKSGAARLRPNGKVYSALVC